MLIFLLPLPVCLLFWCLFVFLTSAFFGYVSKIMTSITLNLIVQCSKSIVISVRSWMRLSELISLDLLPGISIHVPTPCISISSIGSAIYSLMSIIISSVTQTKEYTLILGHRRPSSWCIFSEIILMSCWRLLPSILILFMHFHL